MDSERRPDAILIVHGIGEQVSNDTARSLAVALADPVEDRVRSAADLSIDGAKQRVYAVVWDIEAPTVSPESHVSEGYWAYRFRDTTWSHVSGWLLPLARRPRREAPTRLKVGRAWLSNLLVGVGCLAGLLTVLGVWTVVPLGYWFASTGLAAAAVVGAGALLLSLFVFVFNRLPPRHVVWSIAAVSGLLALLDILFSWLIGPPVPWWFDFFPITPLAMLVVVVLISLSLDVLTSVRVLAVATATVTLTLLGTATNQDDVGSAVLPLLASVAAPWASAAAAGVLLPSLGDAARYFRDHPGNEDESRHIRKIVIDKLRELHHVDNEEARFERVIVIGHSLGSVIAYDALNHFWAETNGRLTVGGPPTCEICASRDLAALQLEQAAHGLVSGLGDAPPPEGFREKLAAYRQAQWDLSTNLRADPTEEHRSHLADQQGLGAEPAWLVTDFITLGSPLASVSFLAEPGSGGVFLPESPKAGTDSRWRHVPAHLVNRAASLRRKLASRDTHDGQTAETLSISSAPTPDRPTRNLRPDDTDLAPDDVRRPSQSWFESKLAAREYPSCPPLSQTAAALDPIRLSSGYPLRYAQGRRGRVDKFRHLHHAAAFAPTRWTNVYFDNDLVAGPVSAQLGRGILDLELAVASPTPRNFTALFSHTNYWTEPSARQLKTPAETSRKILTDLIELRPDLDTFTPVEVNNLENLVWCARSPAQSAALSSLDRLESRRSAAFGAARRDTTWSETLAALGRNRAPDKPALLALMKQIRDRHQDACLAVVAYGEIALYRIHEGRLHRSEYRTVGLRAHKGQRYCRKVTVDHPWPGTVEPKDFASIETWVDEFLTADI